MKLKIVAPFQTNFYLNLGVRTFLENDYKDFWHKAEKQLTLNKPDYMQDIDVNFLHGKTTIEDRKSKFISRYFSIDQDDLLYPIEFLQLDIKNNPQNEHFIKANDFLQQEQEQLSLTDNLLAFDSPERINPNFNSITIKVYDYGIGILIVELRVNQLNTSEDKLLKADLDKLIKIGVKFGERSIKYYTEQVLDNFFNSWLVNLDYSKNFLAIKSNFSQAYPQNSRVLWVTRSLIIEETDFDDQHQDAAKSLKQKIIKHWLKNTGYFKTITNKEQNLLKNDDTYSIAWLNYLFRERVPSEIFNDAYEALYLAQYYYSALECLNDDLHKIIGTSYKVYRQRYRSFFYGVKDILNQLSKFRGNRRYNNNYKDNLRSLKKELDLISSRANMLIVEYHEIQKYLKRRKKQIFNTIIVEHWSFAKIIDNTEYKLECCRQQIDELHKLSERRSNFITESLLAAIGFVAIVEFFLALSQYGRTLSVDATISREENLFFFNLISNIPSDIILAFSLFLVILLLIYYIYWRSRNLL